MKAPGPARTAALGLALVGAGVLALNRAEPDESLWLGLALAALGAACAALPEQGRGAERRAAWITGAWALALALAGGEAGLRWQNEKAKAAYASDRIRLVDDPELRYELLPGRACGAGETSSRGMIDVERAEAKPPGVLRVACLGDSVGGDCELFRENACAALEGELSRSLGGRAVEALNFSVPGYNTLQEARTLERKGLAFSPDAVVVLYVINDPYPDLAIARHLPGHLQFEHLLYSGAALALSRLIPIDPIGSGLAALHDRPRSWEGVVVRGFSRIAEAARARGIPGAVAVFPLFVDPIPPAHAAVYRKVAAEAERHGLAGIDLSTTAFAGRSLASLRKPSGDLIHPAAEAHALAARALAQALAPRLGGAR